MENKTEAIKAFYVKQFKNKNYEEFLSIEVSGN